MSPEEKRYFESKFNPLQTRVDDLYRGVYGDEQNSVPGLIDTDKSQHQRIKSLEDLRKKVLWIGAGIMVALEGLWHFFSEFFKSMFK